MHKPFLMTLAGLVALSLVNACVAAAPDALEPRAEAAPSADTPATAASNTEGDIDRDADARADEPVNEAHEWLERIEQRAAEIDTLHARLRYVRVQGLLGDRQIRFGELRYDAGPPQRFAIHFDRLVVDDQLQQRQRHYIFDGHWLAELQHERRLFIRRELVPEDADENEQMFALDDGPFVLPLDLEKDKVLERFEVSLIPPRENAQNANDQELVNTVHLRLDARPHVDVRQRRLDVWYDRDTRLPVRIRGEDEDDDHWIIQLMQTQTGVAIDEAIFDTQPPREAGWQVEINPLRDEQ